MSESFKFGLAGEKYKAKIGNTVVCLFRKQPEIDYFKVVSDKKEQAVYIFNNQELARQIGGFVLQGDFDATPTHYPDSSFKERYGWNAPVILEDTARQYEIDLYIQANTHDVEDTPEWLA